MDSNGGRLNVRSIALSVSLAVSLACVSSAHAFCGFYVASADAELRNNATMVVMMREGTKTVLSMQNDYQGPAEDFAMVVPVPIVLREANVRTLPREVFDRVDQLAAPRLVEYWEQDPCQGIGLGNLGTIGFGGGGGTGSGYGRGAGGAPLVTVEAEFAVGEYDIVILGARDSSALDAWLREHGYSIPDGAGEVLRPYVEEGMKFFVAKVNADRVTFEDGRAILSPLRVWYDDETFRLPVRLGLLNSPGKQDLVVHVLARNQRYEVANYPNVTIPTNLDVTNEVRSRFGEFYAALFDRTVEQSNGAVVTEYAWQATNCDPCPGPVLSESDLMTLGADVVLPRDEQSGQAMVSQVRFGAVEVTGSLSREVVRRIVRRHVNQVRFCHETEARRNPTLAGELALQMTVDGRGVVTAARAEGEMPAALRSCVETAARRWSFPAPQDGAEVRATQTLHFVMAAPPSSFGFGVPAGPFGSFVLTRLHYRYSEDGLGEDLVFRAVDPIVGGREMRDPTGALEKDAQPAQANNFQGRYIIRHPWEGEIECESPVRGIWGSAPESEGAVARGTQAATDTALVPRGNVDLGAMLKDGLSAIAGVQPVAGGGATEETANEAEEPAAPAPAAATSDGGCGCSASSADAAATLLPLLLVLATLRRRR